MIHHLDHANIDELDLALTLLLMHLRGRANDIEDWNNREVPVGYREGRAKGNREAADELQELLVKAGLIRVVDGMVLPAGKNSF